MRFFKNNRNAESSVPSESDETSPDSESVETPQTHEPEPEAVEFSVPEGGTLDDLYDAEGNSLYTTEADEPCDADGNLIPTTRAEAETVLPETAPPPALEPPAAETPPAQRPEAPTFRSPMADGLLTAAERAHFEERGYDTDSLDAMALLASRVADRMMAARDQQRIAARSLEVDEDIYEELAPRIAQVQHLVPEGLRGTRNGAMTEIALAALSEAMETGDFRTAFAKLSRNRQGNPAPESRTPQLQPPSARVPSPRPNPDSRTVRASRGPRDAANESFHMDGLDGDVVAILQRERKVRY